PGLGAVEGSGRLQLSADDHVCPGHAASAAGRGISCPYRRLVCALRHGAVVASAVSQLRRLSAPGGRAGAGGGALCGLLGAQGALDRDARLGRHGGPRRWLRGRGAAGSAHAARLLGLWLCRHHRGVRWPAPPGRYNAVGDLDEHVLYRRRARAIAARRSPIADWPVSGAPAVCAPGLRYADRPDDPLEAHAGPRSARGARSTRSTMMDSSALLIAASLHAGTVLAFAALGLVINERAGVVNLGAEGMMLVAALAGFAVTVRTGEPWLGLRS